MRNADGVRFCEVFDAIETKAMGLLHRAALKHFDENPQACLEFPELYKQIRDKICPAILVVRI